MTRARTRPRTWGRVRPGLLVPGVVAIVLGILAMHGVGAHGLNIHGATVPGATASAEAATASLAVMPPHEPAAATHGNARPPAHPGMSPTAHSSGDRGGMSGMVMLCVAMLAGAATALLAFLVHRGRPSRIWAVVALARREWRPATRVLCVGTGPPHVWRFSVIRC